MKPPWLDQLITFVSQYFAQKNISAQEKYVHTYKTYSTIEYTQNSISTASVEHKEVLHIVIDLDNKGFNLEHIKLLASLEGIILSSFIVPDSVNVSVINAAMYPHLTEEESYGY